MDENTTLLVQQKLDKLRQESIEKGLIAPSPRVEPTRRHEKTRETRPESLIRGRVPSSLGSKSKAPAEAPAQPPAPLGDRANLQDLKRVSSISQMQTSGPDPLETLNALSAQIKSSHDEAIQPVFDNHRMRRTKTSTYGQHRPLSPPIPLEHEAPKADLVRDTFARLGAPNVNVNSSVMRDINASKTTLPEDRRAAAIARLERKRAERTKEQLGERNKENHRPSMA